MTDFNSPDSLSQTPYSSTFNGQPIVLDDIYFYQGPITLQYLPNGGIQSIFQGRFIVATALGFIGAGRIIYCGKAYTAQEFTAEFADLVNQVMPN